MSNHKKIGIITFHQSINYGAYLQSYALQKAIKDTIKEEADVEIINYTPFKVKLFYWAKLLSKILGKNNKGFLRQYLNFKKALSRLPIGSKISGFTYEAKAKILSRKYDVIIIGSDEVLTAGKHKYRDFPSIYWLSDIVRSKKMVYAGSANRVEYSKLSNQDLQFVKKCLEHYDYIGLRDEHTMRQVKYAAPSVDFKYNCDPTLLIDFNSEFIQEKEVVFNRLAALTDKLIICIMTKNEEVVNVLRNKLGNKYFYLALYYENKSCDSFIADLSPAEWAVSFPCFAGCVTQMFHGTLFCIKNELPFISIDNNSLYDGRKSTKISDVLSRIDLKENYFNLREKDFSYDDLANQFEENLESKQSRKMKEGVKSLKSSFLDFERSLNEYI